MMVGLQDLVMWRLCIWFYLHSPVVTPPFDVIHIRLKGFAVLKIFNSLVTFDIVGKHCHTSALQNFGRWFM